VSFQHAATSDLEALSSPDDHPNDEADEVGDGGGGDVNANVHTNDCAGRWRNAGPESRKKMFALFSVSGIFLVVCRHGHVLFICDMIRSGELYVATPITWCEILTCPSRFKYPLAIMKHLFDTYGADIAVGYDVACTFSKTLLKSSLGARATELRYRGIVPSFHGYSHNRACQLVWHPMHVDGVGIEDFEECERTFAKSNELASATRLATAFHRHQKIDQHFAFHDLDKYAESGQ
jgi:hypothetical protein